MTVVWPTVRETQLPRAVRAFVIRNPDLGVTAPPGWVMCRRACNAPFPEVGTDA